MTQPKVAEYAPVTQSPAADSTAPLAVGLLAGGYLSIEFIAKHRPEDLYLSSKLSAADETVAERNLKEQK